MRMKHLVMMMNLKKKMKELIGKNSGIGFSAEEINKNHQMKTKVISTLILCVFFFKAHTQSNISYPEYSCQEITDDIFGTKAVDQYREFEDFRENQDVIDFYKEQDQITEQYFKDNTLSKSYEKYLRNIDKNENDLLYDIKVSHGGSVFIHKKIKGQYRSKLYYRKSINAEETLLYTPRASDTNRKDRHKISAFQPSWDGKKVVIGLKNNNSFASKVIVLDMVSGALHQTNISNARPNEYWDFNWIPNTNSFSYTTLRTVDVNDSNNSINTSLAIYDMDKRTTKEIFGNGIGPNMDNRLIPLTRIHSQRDKYLIVYLAGSSRYWDAYFTPFDSLSSNPQWKPLLKAEDKSYLTRAQLQGDSLIYINGKDNENHNISVINLQSNLQTLMVPELKNQVITDLELISDGLAFTAIENGTKASLYTYRKDSLQKIELPIKASKIELSTYFEDQNNLYLDIKSILSSGRRFKYDIAKNTFIEEFLYTSADIPEFKDITYTTVDVKSHDGTLVPMTIVHKENITLDGKNPLFSYSYGAFGNVKGNKFNTQYLSFVALGGVLVYPHIRGGGAKGDKWHKAGMKTTKSNSWKDLIACMDYLVENKYTTHNNITLYGASAGAIPIAMAINERPDLAGAVVTWAGVFNPLRRSDKYGKNSFLEYGDITDSVQAVSLIKMDPYINIPKKTKLPAIFVSQSINDDRVYLYEPLKYVAKAQKNSVSDNLILLDIDYRGSHRSSGNFYKFYGRVFSFVIDHTPFNPEL